MGRPATHVPSRPTQAETNVATCRNALIHRYITANAHLHTNTQGGQGRKILTKLAIFFYICNACAGTRTRLFASGIEKRPSHRSGTRGIVVVIPLKQIREKEQLEYEEDDSELNQNQYPEITPCGHLPEAVSIKPPYPLRKRDSSSIFIVHISVCKVSFDKRHETSLQVK